MLIIHVCLFLLHLQDSCSRILWLEFIRVLSFTNLQNPCSMKSQYLDCENSTLVYENQTSCCFEEYREEVCNQSNSERPFVIQMVQDGVQGTGVLELSYLFYGFYPRQVLTLEKTQGWKYNLPLAYLLVVVVTLVLSLVLVVREAARGLRESLRSSEGQFYQVLSVLITRVNTRNTNCILCSVLCSVDIFFFRVICLSCVCV